MASPLYYKITASAPGRPKGVLCIVVSSTVSKVRKVYQINGIVDPDWRFWDKKAGRFLSGTDTGRQNNPIIEEMCERCNLLLNTSGVSTPDDFISALNNCAKPKEQSLGDFIQGVIEEMRTGGNNKRPSKSYQPYINLLHKLEREGEIMHMPISEINNSHFIRFSKFILSLSYEEGKGNYLNIMKLFKQIHKKAYDRELNDNALRFKYSDEAPMREESEKRDVLSLTQYNKFKKMDLKVIPHSGPNSDFYMDLYRDFCIFLYETKCRPVDVLKAHKDNIIEHNGRKYFRYIAEKKKNYRSKDKFVASPLSPDALKIISKYKNKSSQGYIFPFSMNEYKWDFSDAKSWNRWNNRKSRALEMINQWLKKVSKIIKVDFEMTIYTFRHSAFTHACMKDGANYMKIALDGGTSIDMLQKYYVTNMI